MRRRRVFRRAPRHHRRVVGEGRCKGQGVGHRAVVDRPEELVRTEAVGHMVVVDKLEELVRMAAVE